MKLVKLSKDMIVGDIPRVKGQILFVKDSFNECVTIKKNAVDKASLEYADMIKPKPVEVKPKEIDGKVK